MLYTYFNKERSNQRIQNILNLSTLDTNCKLRIPKDDEIGRFSISQCYASIICVLFEINIDNTESMLKMMRLIASEYYNALISHHEVRNIQFINNTFLCIYDTPEKTDIDELIEVAARVNMLYGKFKEKLSSNSSILTSIGINYAPIFYMGLGTLDDKYPKIMYQGDEIQKTIEMAKKVKGNNKNIIITSLIEQNIKKEYKEFFSSFDTDFISSVSYNL